MPPWQRTRDEGLQAKENGGLQGHSAQRADQGNLLSTHPSCDLITNISQYSIPLSLSTAPMFFSTILWDAIVVVLYTHKRIWHASLSYHLPGHPTNRSQLLQDRSAGSSLVLCLNTWCLCSIPHGTGRENWAEVRHRGHYTGRRDETRFQKLWSHCNRVCQWKVLEHSAVAVSLSWRPSLTTSPQPGPHAMWAPESLCS